MPIPTKYQSEIKTVPFGNGNIKIENLTPVLPPREREHRKHEIEKCLFNVFCKYVDKKRK